MTDRTAALEAVADAARRALDSLMLLVRDTLDPSVEALIAEQELSKALSALDAAGPRNAD